ncbi:hypothetical protein D9757_006694 [Collybiopsis confluens]|uniref:Uncharacterized protein n=1 Tax=Collybiopsis confluens TaxID=2823264 RepID=A0A8H5MA11_9AGAR|nr:hypothetical protein D9757_006694 [Collybiopsis confluens]
MLAGINVSNFGCDSEPKVTVKSVKFWPKVDVQMAKLLGTSADIPKSEIEILSDFKDVYDMDIEKYGRPQIKPVNISDNFPWVMYVKRINKFASKASQSEKGRSRGAKRKRSAVSDEYEEEGLDGAGDEQHDDETEGA